MYKNTKVCEKCTYWKPFENNPGKGVCTHPERQDTNSIFYYGCIRAQDYCVKFLKRKEEIANESNSKNNI